MIGILWFMMIDFGLGYFGYSCSVALSNYLVLWMPFWPLLSFNLSKVYQSKFKLRLLKAINLLRWEANDVNPVSVKFLFLNK